MIQIMKGGLLRFEVRPTTDEDLQVYFYTAVIPDADQLANHVEQAVKLVGAAFCRETYNLERAAGCELGSILAKYRISFLGGSISSLLLSTPEDESDEDDDEDNRERREARHFELLAAQDDLRDHRSQVDHVLDDATIHTCLELLDAAVEEMEAKRDETAEAAAVHAENMDALRQWADEGDAEQPR